MKSKFFLTLIPIAFLLSIQTAQAQRRENIVKIGLIEPFLSSFGIGYERFLPDTELSFQLGGSITQRKMVIWENLEPKASGYNAELQVRYYYPVKKSIPSGIYAGLFGEYSQLKINMDIPDGTINFLDGNSKFIGFLLGYQLGFKSRLFLDGTLGGGYHIADYSGRFAERGRIIPSIVSNGFLPKLDLKFGFAF